MAPLSPYDLRTAVGRGPEGFPAGHRWDSFPEIRFAVASPVEGRRFEPSGPPGLRDGGIVPSRAASCTELHCSRGTEGSNLLPSSGESVANPIF